MKWVKIDDWLIKLTDSQLEYVILSSKIEEERRNTGIIETMNCEIEQVDNEINKIRGL